MTERERGGERERETERLSNKKQKNFRRTPSFNTKDNETLSSTSGLITILH